MKLNKCINTMLEKITSYKRLHLYKYLIQNTNYTLLTDSRNI